MMFRATRLALGGVTAAIVAVSPAVAQTPRDILTEAAFVTTAKSAAIAQVNAARTAATAALRRTPADREAQFQVAMATGYAAKLTRNRADAVSARKQFEALAASNPRDPETQAAVAGWHLDSIADLGSLAAGMALGAKKAAGLAALDRAVAVGGQRALFPGIASLMRIRLDKGDIATARRLAEAAVAAPAPTRLDAIVKRNAGAVLVPLRAGNGAAASALAARLLPFGRLKD